ncbi:MAG TPA: tetratricopeptide repeat protein [Burkholderiales bacterium]
MSLINKMLRDIDQRAPGALAQPASIAEAQRPVDNPAARRTVFFVIGGLALAVVLGAAVWATWRSKPSKLMSQIAFQQAAEAQKRNVPPPAAQPSAPAPAPAVPAPQPQSAPPPIPQSEAAPIATPPDTAPAPPKPRALPRPKATGQTADRTKVASQDADKNFVQAVALLNKGRVSEAEQELNATLQKDPANVPARQAYVALLLEQGRTDAARTVLSDTLARDPTQPMFALALARIDVQQRNFAAALQVMDAAGPSSSAPDFQALRGAVFQRMGRHADAVQAFQSAVTSDNQPAQTWISLAISLEALGRRAEAAQAYRRGMAAGSLPPEVRDYAAARLRAVD